MINTATNETIEVPDRSRQIKVGRFPLAIAITPDGKFAYVVNEGGTEPVSVIDTSTNELVEFSNGTKNIDAGINPTSIAITPDGKFAYVTTLDRGVSVIDTTTEETISVPGESPIGSKLIRVGVGGTLRTIAISPDGRSAYVLIEEGPASSVSVIDTRTNEVVEFPNLSTRIPVAEGSAAITVSPDGKFAYLTSSDRNSVGAIDLSTNQGVQFPDGTQQILVGPTPIAISTSADGSLPTWQTKAMAFQ